MCSAIKYFIELMKIEVFGDTKGEKLINICQKEKHRIQEESDIFSLPKLYFKHGKQKKEKFKA